MMAKSIACKLLSRVRLCDPMDYSPGSSVHGILQARILEWVAIPFFRGSSRPRDRTQVSCTERDSKSILLVFSSSSFMASSLMLKSSSVWCEKVVCFDSFAYRCPVFPTPFIEEIVFSHYIFLSLLLFIVSILFCGSMCLFFVPASSYFD